MIQASDQGQSIYLQQLDYSLQKLVDSANHTINEPSVPVISDDVTFVALDERIRKIESLLAALPDKLNALVEAQEQAIELNQAAEQSVTPRESPTPLNRKQMAAERMAKDRQSTLTMEAMLSNPQSVDPAWSTATEITIDETIRGTPELSVARTFHNQCSDIFCKTTVTLPDNLGALEKDIFNWTLIQKLGEELPSVRYSTIRNSDGTETLVYYFGRAGHKLP